MAQITEGDILSDSLIRAGYVNLGRAGFDSTASNGFYIQDSRKAKFRLNIGAWTTPRYNHITLNNTPDSVGNIVKGYEINRTRIYFTGKYSDKFSLEFNNLFSIMNKTIVSTNPSLGFAESEYYGQKSIPFQIQFGF